VPVPAHPAPIDGYDWDIADDAGPTYHPRDVADARRWVTSL